ncbi:hypothetical protein [Scopulibacillus cellulosilyticus]|uniref:PsbP protein n=1 Tax=Scopulibacillus cellulosilyticus TaxID=2665665 RepID=A0ABW2PYP0_9BACL
MSRQLSYRIIGKVAAACVISGAILGGCSSDKETAGNEPSPKKEEHAKENRQAKQPELKGTPLRNGNGSLQLTLPDGWQEDKLLNPQAALAASNRTKDEYILVFAYAKREFSKNARLDNFINAMQANMKVEAKNMVVGQENNVTVDRLPAKQVNIKGEISGIKAEMLVTYLEKGDYFFQMMAWTSEDKYEGSKQDLKQVSESLRILKNDIPNASSGTPNASNGALTQGFKSNDGNSAIKLPADWRTESNLNPDASIQASNTANEEYLVIISEPKSHFNNGFKLKDYYNIVIKNMNNAVQNASSTKPVSIKINQKPALQYELSGEVENIKLSYLVTLVESPDGFHQVIFWTLKPRMNDNRQFFKDAAETFQTK